MYAIKELKAAIEAAQAAANVIRSLYQGNSRAHQGRTPPR